MSQIILMKFSAKQLISVYHEAQNSVNRLQKELIEVKAQVSEMFDFLIENNLINDYYDFQEKVEAETLSDSYDGTPFDIQEA